MGCSVNVLINKTECINKCIKKVKIVTATASDHHNKSSYGGLQWLVLSPLLLYHLFLYMKMATLTVDKGWHKQICVKAMKL